MHCQWRRGQLLWRDHFSLCGAFVPAFDSMEKSPICRNIDWNEEPEVLAAWAEGRTGFPWIDAIMTQASGCRRYHDAGEWLRH